MMTAGTLGEMVMRQYTPLGTKRLGRPPKAEIKRGSRATKPSPVENLARAFRLGLHKEKAKLRSESFSRYLKAPRTPPISAYQHQVQSLTQSFTKAK